MGFNNLKISNVNAKIFQVGENNNAVYNVNGLNVSISELTDFFEKNNMKEDGIQNLKLILNNTSGEEQKGQIVNWIVDQVENFGEYLLSDSKEHAFEIIKEGFTFYADNNEVMNEIFISSLKLLGIELQ